MLQQCKHWRRYVHSVYAEDLLSTVHKQWWKEMSRGIHSFIGERPNTIMTWWWGKYFSCSSRFKCIKYQHFATFPIKLSRSDLCGVPWKMEIVGVDIIHSAAAVAWIFCLNSCWHFNEFTEVVCEQQLPLKGRPRWSLLHQNFTPLESYSTRILLHQNFTPPEFYSPRILLY